jgi:hypothetical protein
MEGSTSYNAYHWHLQADDVRLWLWQTRQFWIFPSFLFALVINYLIAANYQQMEMLIDH